MRAGAPANRTDVRRELSWKKHIWPIFMPGHNFTGNVDTFDNSNVI